MAAKKKGGPPQLGTWTKRTPAGGFSGAFHGAAYHDGVFLIVGDNGEIQQSVNNGVTWSRITSGTTNTIIKIIHDGSDWRAVGVSGMRLHSSNGASWTVGNIGYTGSFNGTIDFNGQYYVIGMGNGRVYRTTNFTGTWSQITSGVGTGRIYASAANGSDIVHVSTPSSNSGIRYSTNSGQSWSSVSNTNVGHFGAVYGDGLWVAVGAGIIRTSTNLTQWTQRTVPPAYRGNNLINILYINGMFVGISDAATGAYYSYDGIIWQLSNTGISSSNGIQPNGLTSSDDVVVAVGVGGEILTCQLEY
ncbi:WD40/YVTN/BNR-like repeat-containing protein [Pseudochelatococcus sp. B33]